MLKRIQVLFIFALVITSTRFFGANFLNHSFVNYSQFAIAFLAIAISLPYFFSKPTGFIFPVQVITVAIVISVFMAYVSWGQSFKDTLLVTIPMLLWPFFFYLNHFKISVKLIEKIILFYGGMYILIYFYQYTHPDVMLFGKSLWGDEFVEDRGVLRIVPPGGAMFFLAVFISLNKFTTAIKGRWIWLPLIIFGLITPVMQVTRITLFGVGIIYIFHFLRGKNIPKQVIMMISCVLIVLCMSIFYTEIKQLNGMVEAQQQTAQEGKEYIRVLAGTYFLTEFSPANINVILGNGVPYINFTFYGRFLEMLNEQYGYYLEDMGIIAIYVMYGIMGVVAYILIWIKSFIYKLPKEYQYVKYNLFFLFLNGFTTDNLNTSEFLLSTVFALYIYQTILRESKKQKEIEHYINSLDFPVPVSKPLITA